MSKNELILHMSLLSFQLLECNHPAFQSSWVSFAGLCATVPRLHALPCSKHWFLPAGCSLVLWLFSDPCLLLWHLSFHLSPRTKPVLPHWPSSIHSPFLPSFQSPQLNSRWRQLASLCLDPNLYFLSPQSHWVALFIGSIDAYILSFHLHLDQISLVELWGLGSNP